MYRAEAQAELRPCTSGRGGGSARRAISRTDHEDGITYRELVGAHHGEFGRRGAVHDHGEVGTSRGGGAHVGALQCHGGRTRIGPRAVRPRWEGGALKELSIGDEYLLSRLG